ncbi:Protein of unknown function [Cotesia congregata]|uniref:Uncharacterized protein n=1 Tax=Cotesia congregata TaxID=51543 RepID=A0A8J2E9V4_COTCN|nr:Protein of unknown function [Cotesia congregata]
MSERIFCCKTEEMGKKAC